MTVGQMPSNTINNSRVIINCDQRRRTNKKFHDPIVIEGVSQLYHKHS